MLNLKLFYISPQQDQETNSINHWIWPEDYHYTIIDLYWGGHGVLLNSKRHIDGRGAEVNMIKFTVQKHTMSAET